MAVLRGTNAVVTKDGTTMTDLKVHAWVLRQAANRFDVTGDADTNPVFAMGDRTVDLQLECSVTGSTMIREGESITVVLEPQSAATDADFTDTFVVEEVVWQVEKRGGGAPQRVSIRATANAEAASNETATTGFFSAT